MRKHLKTLLVASTTGWPASPPRRPSTPTTPMVATAR